MVLHDQKLREAVQAGLAEGKNPAINPNSIDLTLGGEALLPKQYSQPIRYGGDASSYWEAHDLTGGITLAPGSVMLAHTAERIRMPPHLCGQVFAKSSLGRLFINHMMAGVIDAGFEGTLTLELKNEGVHPVTLHAGDPVVQLVVMELTGEAEAPYGERPRSRYQGQDRPTAARKAPDL